QRLSIQKRITSLRRPVVSHQQREAHSRPVHTCPHFQRCAIPRARAVLVRALARKLWAGVCKSSIMVMVESAVSEREQCEKELREAGWQPTAVHPNSPTWRSPDGQLYPGPGYAWVIMKTNQHA